MPSLYASYSGHYWGQNGVKGPNLNSDCPSDGGFEARLPLQLWSHASSHLKWAWTAHPWWSNDLAEFAAVASRR